MQLIEVRDDQTRRQFLEMPLAIYRDHPVWIRPLDKDIEAVFDPAKNKSFRNGEAVRWLLQDEKGQIIGRVAAFVAQKNTLAKGEVKAGGMGFFECIDSPEAAHLLFDTCRNWLQARGLEAMDGPINFGQRDRFWGLLVDGFVEPNYGMFYHPPYYQALFESYGFQLYFKQYTCYRDMKTPLNPAYASRYEKVTSDPNFSFRYISKKGPEKIAKDLHHVYNLAWGSHSDVGELSLDVVRGMVKQMMPVIDEKLIWFGYYGEEAVSFFIMLPELNRYFRHFNGKFGLLQKLHFLYLKTFRPTNKAFGLLFGVVPVHQGKGVEAAMIKATEAVLIPTHYEHLEMNWIGDFNPKMMVVVRMLGSKILKTHHTYRYMFDRNAHFERYPIIK